MAALPNDAKNIIDLQPFRVDTNGDHVCFGFTLENSSRIMLHCDHYRLGSTIKYLQGVATEARERRIKVNPNCADFEIHERHGNPVTRLDFDIELNGQSTALMCTTAAGTSADLQLSYELLENIHRHLPTLLAEMRRRQSAHRRMN